VTSENKNNKKNNKLYEFLNGESKQNGVLIEADGTFKELIMPNGDKLPNLSDTA